MPYSELLEWLAYFERRPVGWRSDDATFKLLQAQGVKGKPQNFFSSLVPIYSTSVSTDLPDGELSVSNLKGSALFANMLNAVGGDALPF